MEDEWLATQDARLMSWFKVDDMLHSHPKARRAGLEALGLWAVAGSHCMAYLSDGFVEDWFVESWAGGLDLADKLVEVGLWVERPGGWQFHDWLEFQDSKSKVVASQEASRKRQQAWRDKQRYAMGNNTGDVTDDVTRYETCDQQDPAGVRAPVTQTQPIPKEEISPKEVVDNKPPPKKAAAKKVRKRTAIQADWMPSESQRNRTAEQNPGRDLRAELAAFIDHHQSKGTLAADWDATWRTWFHNSYNAKWLPGHGPNGKSGNGSQAPRQTAVSRKMEAAKDLFNQLATPATRLEIEE